MQHAILVAIYALLSGTVAVVGQTVIALLGALPSSRRLSQQAVRHVCEDPEECEADLLVAGLAATHKEMVTELWIAGSGLAVGVGSLLYGFIHLVHLLDR